jgi:hypothetical protein
MLCLFICTYLDACRDTIERRHHASKTDLHDPRMFQQGMTQLVTKHGMPDLLAILSTHGQNPPTHQQNQTNGRHRQTAHDHQKSCKSTTNFLLEKLSTQDFSTDCDPKLLDFIPTAEYNTRDISTEITPLRQSSSLNTNQCSYTPSQFYDSNKGNDTWKSSYKHCALFPFRIVASENLVVLNEYIEMFHSFVEGGESVVPSTTLTRTCQYLHTNIPSYQACIPSPLA